PLFEIVAKDETYFAYDQQEKAEICKRLGNTKYVLQRSKGLGENEPEMMWLTTMCPETRRLIKVTPSMAQETADTFELLLGDNLAGRKEYIAEFGGQYLELADIS
ncbi:MAG: DNA topoisomerase, partial [Angelakisella sp.]